MFDGAGVEKQIKPRDGVVRVDANFLNGTGIVYDETRAATDDIKTFIATGCEYENR